MALALRNKAYIASFLVIGGYGSSQVLRLACNLVLTRMLVPEFFGIMAIAQVFMMGIELFSDMGIGPGIIRSQRSNDSDFINTAWTLQIIRGGILWMLTMIIALPVATIYKTPILANIIPVIGLTFVVTSFSSTSIFTLNKKVQLGKITTMELVSQFIGMACMILLAYLYKNVWALVVGSLVAIVVKTLWSYFLEPDSHHHFALERESVKELISFGKWIFVSTAMMFLATQSDRLLLGKLLPIALFGVYNIAVIFAEIPKQILSQLSNKIIFPLMTHYVDLPRQKFRQKILQKRKLLLLALVLLVAIFTSFGDIIIYYLYDSRYHQAGWMLPLLALGMWPFVLCASIDRCFYAIGKPQIPAAGNFCKFIYMVICVPILFHTLGSFGGVLAVVINDLPAYIVNSVGLQKEGMGCLQQDFLFSILLILSIALLLSLRLFFGMGTPAKAFIGID